MARFLIGTPERFDIVVITTMLKSGSNLTQKGVF